MLAVTAHPSNRRYQSAEPHEADKLTGQTCAVLAGFGVNISPSKVARLVHRYQDHVAATGYSFADWIANGIALHVELRGAVIPELMRVVAYADPTGETAVNNVMRAGR